MRRIVIIFSTFLLMSAAYGGLPTHKYSTHLPYKPGSKVPVSVMPKQIKWESLPGGVKRAVLVGDPTKPGLFVVRVKLPTGFIKKPHYHLSTAYLTVLSGHYYRSFRTHFKSNAILEGPGGFSVLPAGTIHSEWVTKGPVTVQIYAMGPWKAVFVDENGKPISKPMEPRHSKDMI